MLRDPVNPRDAIDEEAGGQRPQNQIFGAGFQRQRVTPGERDQRVERDRDYFQRDKDKNEICGGSHPHHTGAS